jgi:hypothetical protein
MATFTNDVEIQILDGGGVVTVPQSNVQLVIGCAPAGPIAQVVATRNPNTLASVFSGGPLVEAAAMAIAAGAIVLAMRATTNTAGAVSTVDSTLKTGTSAVTVTGTPYDTTYVKVIFDVGGTIAAAGIKFRVSLDGGRSYGPQIALGAPVTYVIPGTGVTLNFAAGTIVAGDVIRFRTTEPLPNTAGVQACLAAIQASAYGAAGWGTTHILGPWAGTDVTSINGFLETMKTSAKIFTRAIVNVRDASPPTVYGGTGESEAAWMTAIMADCSAVDAKRMDVCAGHYNMSGQIPLQGVLPKYRRPFSYALAARMSGIPPQRHAGRVRDGALGQINVDPTNDPTDGFVYHDERNNPGLDDARFSTAMTRVKKGAAFYVKNPRLMAAAGSVFWLHPLGAVMDIACDVLTDVGQDDINDDLRLTPTGQLDPREAANISASQTRALEQNMVNAKMLSYGYSVADPDWNVRDTSKVKVRATIGARGYVLEEDIEIGFGSAGA